MNDAIELLGVYTAGRFDIWLLAGNARASVRARIMSALQGTKVPQSKAGVNALRDAFYAALAITGDYPAQREENFVNECRKRTA